jgi:hypothetical protein
MKPEKGREIILEGAKRAYPHAISAKSIKEAGLLPTAEQLVRGKLLLKAKYKGQPAYRLPDPAPSKTVISKRPRGSGAAHEREVADDMKKLRESGGMNIKSHTRR